MLAWKLARACGSIVVTARRGGFEAIAKSLEHYARIANSFDLGLKGPLSALGRGLIHPRSGGRWSDFEESQRVSSSALSGDSPSGASPPSDPSASAGRMLSSAETQRGQNCSPAWSRNSTSACLTWRAER